MSWLGPAAEVWEQRFGPGTFPFAKAGKALGQLYKALKGDGDGSEAAAKIALHLAEYLARVNPDYLNLFKFAETFQAYAPDESTDGPVVDEWGCLTDVGEHATRPRV